MFTTVYEFAIGLLGVIMLSALLIYIYCVLAVCAAMGLRYLKEKLMKRRHLPPVLISTQK